MIRRWDSYCNIVDSIVVEIELAISDKDDNDDNDTNDNLRL